MYRIFRKALSLSMMTAAVFLLPWTIPAHAADGNPPSSLDEVIENFREAWEGGLSQGSEKYKRLNAVAAEKLREASGGRWWVVGFSKEGHPRWLRGVLQRDTEVYDRDRALLEAERVKESLQAAMGWRDKRFAPAAIREDPWTYIVQYQQTHQEHPIDGARLRFRILKEYRPDTGSPEQWNIEVRDDSLAQPRGFFRSEIPAGQALELLKESGLLNGGPLDDPVLLFCPGVDDEAPVFLCWKVETRSKAYHVDALGGRLMRTVEKNWVLR
jgi:hypothetical protein